ncbi:MAG: hypothetical protein AAGC65_01260 [Mucilaginibacter sp.]|uniref:hypothetical protein n=1 Tax=Mucilaginibacter sp. TaxID=1882438 RepID=UPI0031AD82BC
MPKSTLPTYAIVELLIRLSQYNHLIGNYKDHSIFDSGVMVKTSTGSIKLPLNIIQRQFDSPDFISESELSTLALLFKLS